MIISLITREYLNGRISITTDRMGGFRTGNGYSSKIFWQKLIKWTSRRDYEENVNIGIFKNSLTNYENFLSQIDSVNYFEINENYIISNGIDDFDLLYLIGLPKITFSDELPKVIEEYVGNGGGLIIESPDLEGEIEIISLIDSVNVSSIDRPSYGSAFWTQKGIESEIYFKANNFSSFMVEIKESDFSNEWDIILSDVQTISIQTSGQELEIENTINIQDYSNRSFQEFCVGFIIGVKDGTVHLEEGNHESSSTSSSSSSSTIEEFDWDFCENVIANWKLNESNLNSFIWDSSGDFSQIGELKSSGLNINTFSNSVSGKINNAISFLETDENNITVSPGTKLNFTDGLSDKNFAITFWLKPYTLSGTMRIIVKDGIWDIYLINDQLFVKLINGANYRLAFSSASIIENYWNSVIINYNTSDIDIYINSFYSTISQSDFGYSTMSNDNSEIYIGSSSSGDWLNGALDEVKIFDKFLNSSEIDGIWNMGNGTEDCYGTIYYTSSSSSSSS